MCATPPTVLCWTFWNFKGVFVMVWRCACDLDIILWLFCHFFHILNLVIFEVRILSKCVSRTVRPRRLKIGTHVDSGQIYHVYLNQAAAAYSLLYFFISLSLQSSTLKFFVTLFSGTVRPRRLKLGTHVDRCIVYTRIRLLLLIHPFFLSLQFSNIKIFVTLFSRTVRTRRLKLGTHLEMYRVYRNQAAASYSSL